MTEERRKELWNQGWDAFWHDQPQDACPDLPLQEEREEWIFGWLSAQSAELQDPYEHL